MCVVVVVVVVAMVTPAFDRPTAAAAAATSANPTPDRCSHLPPAPVTPPLLANHRYPTDLTPMHGCKLIETETVDTPVSINPTAPARRIEAGFGVGMSQDTY